MAAISRLELTKKQNEILMFLASNPPSIVGEVARGTSQYYPNAWRNVKTLKRAGLAKETGARNGRYPEYWVTPKGASLALDSGVAPNAIVNAIPGKSINAYPFDLVRVLCETVEGIGLADYQRMTKADLLIILGEENLRSLKTVMQEVVKLMKRMQA